MRDVLQPKDSPFRISNNSGGGFGASAAVFEPPSRYLPSHVCCTAHVCGPQQSGRSRATGCASTSVKCQTTTAARWRSGRPGPVSPEHDAVRERGVQRLVLRRRHLQQRRRHLRAAAAVCAALGPAGDHLLEPQRRAQQQSACCVPIPRGIYLVKAKGSARRRRMFCLSDCDTREG